MTSNVRVSAVLGFALLTLSFAPIGCDSPGNEAGTDSATDTGDTGDPGDGGMCVKVERLAPVIEVSVDGTDGPMPSLDATCILDVSSVDAGTWSLELSCTDAEANPSSVTITAPAEATPTGVELGDSLELSLKADGSFELGSGPTIELRDADGPILAQVVSSTGSVTWAPITLAYASYCEATDEFEVETLDGYVHAKVGEQSLEVLVGEPQVLSDGTHSWDVHALYAYSQCCHGDTIDAALVRR